MGCGLSPEDLEVIAAMRPIARKLPQVVLWDVRRLALVASHREAEIPIKHFEEALSEGLKTLPKKYLVRILKEIAQGDGPGQEIVERLTQALGKGYQTSDLNKCEAADLHKVAGDFWRELKEVPKFRWLLSRYKYAHVIKELRSMSGTLGAISLLKRLVYIGCNVENLVQEAVHAIGSCYNQELKTLAELLYGRLSAIGRIHEDYQEDIQDLGPDDKKVQRLWVVTDLLGRMDPDIK